MKQEYVIQRGRRIKVSVLPATEPPRVRPIARTKFVQMPTPWIKKLAGQNGKVHDLALLLLKLNFEHRGRPVKLSNVALQHLNLWERKVKYRALGKLERLGLISVRQKPGAAPLVTLNLSL